MNKIIYRHHIISLVKEYKQDKTKPKHSPSQYLENLLSLSEKTVQECMIPRTNIVAINNKTSISEILKIFIKIPFSKLIVYKNSIDEILGIISVKDLFQKPKDLNTILRPVLIVPYSRKAYDVMLDFQKSNYLAGIVLDEYGGTAGMVTLEDVLEEILGEIYDEHDLNIAGIKQRSQNSYLVNGDVELDILQQKIPQLQIDTTDESIYTIAGYILLKLVHVPQINETISTNNWQATILKSAPQKIEQIELIITPNIEAK